MAKTNYTDAMVDGIKNFGGKYEGSIPYADVTAFTEEFNTTFEVEFSQRMISGKLRYLGYDLDKKVMTTGKRYTEAEEQIIRDMCSDPENLPFLEAVAEAVGRDTKSVGGKLISMKIFGVKKEHLKVKEVVEKKFSPDDEVKILEMTDAEGDTFVEDIAEALSKTVQQVRGKLAGMRIKGVLTRNKAKGKAKVYTDEVLARIEEMLANGSPLEAIAEDIGVKLAGLKSIAAKKGLIAKSSKGKFWTDERKDELVTLVEEGKTREDIAELFSTTIAVIAKQAKAMSLDMKVAEKVAA